MKTFEKTLCLVWGMLALVACGKKSEPSAPGLTETPGILGTTVWFVGTDYKHSILYSLNVKTGVQTKEFVFPEGSGDLKTFQWPNEGLYAVERYAYPTRSPTVITRFGTNGVNTQKTGFPVNVYGILGLKNGNMLTTSYEGTLSISPRTLKGDFEVITPRLAPGLKALKSTYFIGALSGKNQRHFALLGGVAADWSPVTAQLVELSEDGKTITRSWDIAGKNPLEECRNAPSMSQTALSKAILSCNPQYSPGAPLNTPTTVVQVDVSEDEPLFTFLATKDAGSPDKTFVSASFASDTHVLVSEVEPLPNYASETKAFYWLNIKTGEKTNPKGYRGDGVYLPELKAWLFSCYLENNTCKANTFAKVPLEALSDSSQVTPVSYQNDYPSFYGFSQRVYSEE